MLNVLSSIIFAIIPVISLGSKISLDEYVVTCLSPPPTPLNGVASSCRDLMTNHLKSICCSVLNSAEQSIAVLISGLIA